MNLFKDEIVVFALHALKIDDVLMQERNDRDFVVVFNEYKSLIVFTEDEFFVSTTDRVHDRHRVNSSAEVILYAIKVD